MQDHAQIPVPKAVTEEEKMAAAQPRGKRNRQKPRQIGAREVFDVVILGDHIRVLIWIAPIDGTVKLEDDATLVQRQASVLIGHLDEDWVAFWGLMHEGARVLSDRDVGDEVELLARV